MSSATAECVKAVSEVEAACNQLQTAVQDMAAKHQVEIAAQVSLAAKGAEDAKLKVGAIFFFSVKD